MGIRSAGELGRRSEGLGSWGRITLFRVQVEGSGTRRLLAEMGVSLLTSGLTLGSEHSAHLEFNLELTGPPSSSPSLPGEERNKDWPQKRDI